ncbi:MAG TPA: metallophosphoesterase [Ramlibacter sp.]
MSSFRIVQISDTHLSREKNAFVGNFEVAAAEIAAFKPDLVVHSGDIAVEATQRPGDLVYARELMDGLSAPYQAIAGNHDVGDNPGDNGYLPHKKVSDGLLTAYEDLFGPSYWQVDAAGWSILGLNAQLFLSGLSAEAEQERWLDEMLSRSRGKPVAVFCHKPLLLERVEEPVDVPYRYVPTEPRRRLAEMMSKADVRLFACGHVHQSRDHVVDGIRHVWAPATAFTLPDAVQPRIGTKACGLVDYVFTPDGVSVDIRFPEGMTQHHYDEVKAAYA